MLSNEDAIRILQQLDDDTPGLDPSTRRQWLQLAAYRLDFYQTGDSRSFLSGMRTVLNTNVPFASALLVVKDLDFKLAPIRNYLDMVRLLEAMLLTPTDETFQAWRRDATG